MINDFLIAYVNKVKMPDQLKSSILYSIRAGGKRLRPILMMAATEAVGGKSEKVLPAAAALEMIHTYSLIHDDLPAMDNDDFRRGMPTNHRKFGEATAILAGDALLTLSFQVIMETEALTSDQKIYLAQRLSQASGASGMVAGQILDMESENQEIELDLLEKIHQCKTGKLISFAISAGAYLGDANEQQLTNITKTGEQLGIIFQIQDDILDVSGDEEKIGKPVGSDTTNKKSTYPQLLGLVGAKRKKEEHVMSAKKSLSQAAVDNTMLSLLIDHLSHRDH
nr:farnesyl diphosphate synthase [Thalassobacillus pellis]